MMVSKKSELFVKHRIIHIYNVKIRFRHDRGCVRKLLFAFSAGV